MPTDTKTTRRAYTFAQSTLDRLDALAEKHGTRDGVILRDALAVYDYIDQARDKAAAEGKTFTVLLDRGDGKPSELLIPR